MLNNIKIAIGKMKNLIICLEVWMLITYLCIRFLNVRSLKANDLLYFKLLQTTNIPGRNHCLRTVPDSINLKPNYMRYVKWLFVVLLIISLVSFVEKDKPTGGLNVGSVAPDFKIESTQNEQKLSLTDLRGKYVLVNFWASYDAQSRMRNISFNNALRSRPESIEMVSVSFDEYRSIFDETVRKDQIQVPACFVDIKGENSGLFKKYRLKRGFTNYLLDDKGVIIAKNISAEELSTLLSNNELLAINQGQ